MDQFGHFTLCLAWLLALVGTLSGAFAGFTRRKNWLQVTVYATLLVCLCTGLAIFVLGYGFLTDDYTNQYIWQHSNKDMDAIYKIAAIWGGMDGSMLLWAFMLTVSAAIVAFRTNTYPRNLMPWVLAVINSSTLFFLTVVVYLTNPFRYLKADFIPPDGNGLNPLLQNPYMAIHPPTLYLGFTTFAIPFAFCMGALLAGRLDNEWIRLTRRWTLVAWGFLTAGIVLGGHWAYLELGWGGFWAWDPVENSSFLPWLTGTAFLHSVMVQERKNMLKLWNVWLIVLTYGLTVFGTFLTRSGIVQSVHAFASTEVGWVFLLYLALVFLGALVLTFYRRKELRSEGGLQSVFSRETAFLVNNLMFLSICFATLWGVMFPVLSEAVTGTKQTVSIPFFNTVNVPLFMVLIFLMGVGPLIAWRKASFQSLRKTFLAPFISGLGMGAILVWAGVIEFYPVLSYSLCFFVLMTIFGEFHRGLKAQKVSATAPVGHLPGRVARLLQRYQVRYGGYLVHVGVLIMTVAITASMAHKFEKEFTLAAGESIELRRFVLKLDRIEQVKEKNYSALLAYIQLRLRKNGELITILKPELRHYFRNRENTTEVALRMGMREDVYVVLAGTDDSETRAAFKVFINPLQVWLWIGTLVVLFGTVIVAVPRRLGVSVRVAERAVSEELSKV